MLNEEESREQQIAIQSSYPLSEKEDDDYMEKIAELIQMKENAQPIPDGTLIGDTSLQNLHSLIDNVFIPMLVAADRSDKGVMIESAKSPLQQVGSISIIEFMNTLKKFSQHMQHVIQQLSSEVSLDIPDIDIDDPAAAIEDEQIKNRLEQALIHWTATIENLLQTVNMKEKDRNQGPLGEIEFWRERHAMLGTVYEQLNEDRVKKMRQVLQLADVQSPNFDYNFAELTKQYMEAKDNVKFLLTLERHFKNISHVKESLLPISDTLQSMMHAIRMVWVISRHYNTDKTMGFLLELIANEIADRVIDFLDIDTSLRSMFEKPGEIMQHLKEAADVLEKWRQTYMNIKDKIDNSSGMRDKKWDFDREALFQRTTYMTRICNDLYEVATVIDHYKNFLGQELQDVIGNSQGINEALSQVHELVRPFILLNDSPALIFNRKMEAFWRATMKEFHEKVETIRRNTDKFIDRSFDRMKSAENMFKLLKDVMSIHTSDISSDTLNNSIMFKSIKILDRFNEEINEIEDIFKLEEKNPPLTKNMPPVAGAIYWCDSLFQRIRKPFKLLNTNKHMFNANKFNMTIENATRVAKLIKNHENALFDRWKADVQQHALSYLRQNILTRDPASAAHRSMVNFHPQLTLMIQETKYLDKLAKKVPEIALNVTMQEDKYHRYVEKIKIMLDNLNTAEASLDEAEKQVLSPMINKLHKTLIPGYETLNWNSLGIEEFINRCNGEINNFHSVVKKVQKNASVIRSLINQMRNAVLLEGVPLSEMGLLDMPELLLVCEKHVRDQTQIIQKKYETISQTLLKIEGDLISANVILDSKEVTGREKQLKQYYEYWEKRIFRALVRMVMNSLVHMRTMLCMGRSQQRRKRPLTKINVSLSHMTIIKSPEPDEVVKTVNKLKDLIVGSTKHFVRWMDGTCVEVQQVKIAGNVGRYAQLSPKQTIQELFSFHIDVEQVVMPAVLSIGRMASNTKAKIEQYVARFNDFSQYWRIPKELSMEKFNQRNPSWEEYDARLEEYSRNISLLQSYVKPERRCDFILIDCHQLLEQISDELRKWIMAMSKLMNDNIRPKMLKLNEEINSLRDHLTIEIKSIDDLRAVLGTIEDTKRRSIDIERDYREVENCYHTLENYGYDIPPEESEMAFSIHTQWDSLITQSRELLLALVPQREQFAEQTVNDVKRLQYEFAELVREFDNGPGKGNIDLNDGLAIIESIKTKLEEKQNTRRYLLQSEKLFDIPITSYPKLIELDNRMNTIGKIFDVYGEWKIKVEEWARTLWDEVPLKEMEQVTKDYAIALRQQFDSDLQKLQVHATVTDSIKGFQNSIPLFKHLKDPSLRARHWTRLMESTGKNFDFKSSSSTLQHLIDMKLYEFRDQIDEIYDDARKEVRVEKMLRDLEDTWRGMKFTMKKHERDGVERCLILTELDFVNEKLEESTTELQGVSGKHSVPFITDIGEWERKLSRIGETLELWIDVQISWMYLEIIFIGSGDIREQLPELAKAFDKINDDWVKIMTDTSKSSYIMDTCHDDRKFDMLRSLQLRLGNCQKGLTNYLQSKRELFPRFYFISDDQLLSILGSSDPHNVQKQISNMFDNVGQLIFKPESRTVLGMESNEGEKFNFITPVPAEGAVEKWLSAVEQEMRKTLHYKTKEAVFYYPKRKRTEWIKQHLGMCTLAGSQIWWTWEVEDSFHSVKQGDKMAVKRLGSKLTRQLNDLIDAVRTPMDGQSRKKITTMIIIDVHARDIVDGLVRDSILDEREFEWESQLRFYWSKDDDNCTIRQCTGTFSYGYEYQGLNGRLVITPLTDRCFMTLTQALTFHLGGSPAGPAGTGKTESVKDLAKSMAVLCVVFNCSNSLDHLVMHRIFAGLCQTGAWGCFDEFNRIELPVLSVVSTQIRTIQSALHAKLTRFRFEDEDINLDSKCGIFITMNPGYAGRVELPDNLKVMFRPCVMVVPDMEIICEISLASEGFRAARTLARKMTKLYSLAQGQLSKQSHYDWSLRALKAVLVVAGRLKRESPDKNEEELLMRALHDMNAPKFIFEDSPLFDDLLNDLFVSLNLEKSSNPRMQTRIEEYMRSKSLQILDNQVDKVIQLYETMNTRHSVMVVGGTCGGKTVVINALTYAQTHALGLPTSLHILNPKAQTVLELYGHLDEVSRDWHDGLLSRIFRDVNQKAEKGEERRIILFDGDVDAVWIENMNSVMDDNRILTLPNGERMDLFHPQCSLLFEVGDLQYASPATVSRCGMVYVDPKNLGWKPFVWKWCSARFSSEERSAERKELFEKLFDRYTDACIAFVLHGEDTDGSIIERKIRTIIPYTDMNMVVQLCTVLDAIFLGEKKDRENFEEREIECLFIFALYWSIGATIVDDDRERFDAFVKRVLDNYLTGVDNGEKLERSVSAGSYPTRLTLYEYKFDTEEHRWIAWRSIVPDYVQPDDGKFSSILVPTVDTVRYSYLINAIASTDRPVLFVGAPGTAKTVIIQNYLNRMMSDDPDKITTLNINLSSRTSSLDVQRTIEDNIEKKIGDMYGPFSGKQLNILIDDLNMPFVDIYGTQQPIALLKLLFELGGMYERGASLSFKKIRDLHFFSGMAPPGGGRNSVDPRFISKFSVFNINFPSTESLHKIYSSILSTHLESFEDEVKSIVQTITNSTLQLYGAIVQRLPPTPSKFYYIFNLRDLSRVYEGLCLSTIDKFNSSDRFVRLWRNECMRVFYDRLMTDEDQAFVVGKIEEIICQNFQSESEFALSNPLIFGDFKDMNSPGINARLYDDMVDYESVKKVLVDNLEVYNETCSKKMELILFDDAIEHLTRIHRIIRMNRGHALLVGVGGSGKQSLTRLAAFTAGYEVFEIVITRSYGEAQFREDLKVLFSKLGNENKKMVFLFTDAHVAEPAFLEYINNLLTTGMVPALFTDEEKEQVTTLAAKEMKESGMVVTKESKWNYFVDKCRDNLHVVLAMSPAGDTLRIRCRNFPGLVNSTSIDWFTAWPAQALEEVAQAFLDEEILPDEKRKAIANHMVMVHLSVNKFSAKYAEQLRRHNYVTPKNYLDYISTYRTLLKEMRDNLDNMSARLEGGLNKLLEAQEEVQILQKELSIAKTEVVEATKTNDALLMEIESKTLVANQRKAEVQQIESQLEKELIKITEEKEEAQRQLDECQPAIDRAMTKVQTLEAKDINEIRVMNNPPDAVVKVMACVGYLFTRDSDATWASSRRMMNDTGFLFKLLNFIETGQADTMFKTSRGRDRASEARKILREDPDVFTEEGLRSRSVAAAGLLVWIEAMLAYLDVYRVVLPKKRQIEEAEGILRKKTKTLEATKDELQKLELNLLQLEEDLRTGQEKARELRTNAETMERRLNAANKLIDGLSSERSRWTLQIQQFKEERVRLVGDCLLSASFLSYTGAFTVDFRNDMVYDLWCSDIIRNGIPMTQGFKVGNLLTDDVGVSQWESEGLPTDEVSVQNGILTNRASRFPLCIDPQQQAVTWIKNREANLEVSNFNDPNFMKKLEQAIKNGRPFLLENIDEYIDPMIDPVLNIDMRAKRRVVRLGDEEIDVEEGFKLYMCSRLSNPHYSPEVSGKTTLICFSVTQEGLQEQLLNAVVRHERPQLEDERRENVQVMSQNKALLKSLEEKILVELNMSGDKSLLENEDLIQTLDATKEKVTEINEKLVQAAITSKNIDSACMEYTNVARRGAILYFVMASLVSINTMYEYSLASFMHDVFDMSLQKSEQSKSFDTRLKNIVDHLTYSTYTYTCTGLFEEHKLMFAFQMTVKIMESDGAINMREVDFFLKGNMSLEKLDHENPFTWLSDQGWKDLLMLPTLDPAFEHIVMDVEDSERVWKTWYDLEDPERAEVPLGYHVKLTRFQRLCLLKCFRVDRVQHAITMFIIQEMGSDKYVKPPVLDYQNVFQKSTVMSPIVCMISPGYDPANDIIKLAEKLDKSIRSISLGQGQDTKAEEMLKRGIARGHWVLLQNCHLLVKWMRNVEKILDEIKRDKVHAEFRLWLTTEVTPEFPIGILQKSLKVVTEAPNSLLLNMVTTYSAINDSALEECPHPAFRPLVYVLSYFHAVIQERRKYGKIGWNHPYDFNASDFDVSFSLLKTYLTKAHEYNDPIPWESLKYLIGEAMYGGRVTDSYDRRVITTYMSEYMGDFLFDTFQPFHFFSNDKMDYCLPDDGAVTKKEYYEEYIDKNIQLTNGPEVFGLHPNAEISYLTNSTQALWNNLVELQPRVGGTSIGISREDYIANVAAGVQNKIPSPFDRIALKNKIGIPNPIQVVLLQEVERWNLLVSRMKNSLIDLQRALVGDIGMNNELDELAISLFNGYVPEMWKRYAPATIKNLSSWLEHFARRYDQYSQWIERNEDPTVMWLSGLHIPESYLTALVQMTCKRYSWPLDKTTMFTRVTNKSVDEIRERPVDGCYVQGLFMEGASWDLEKNCLKRQDPKVLVTELPVLEVIPVENSKLKLQDTFKVPVYVTADRRNAAGVGLVFEADMRTLDHSSHWVLNGVAMYLSQS